VKITFVLPFINLTGGVRVLLDYANWLHDTGHKVTVVYPCWPYRFQSTRKQQWVEFQKHRAHNGRVPWFDLRCDLLRVPVVRTPFLPQADVVVAAGWAVAHDVVRLPRSRGAKVLIVFHHESGTGPEDAIRAIYRLPFRRIAFSEFVRETTRGVGCEIHAVVPNGVNTARFFAEGEPQRRTVLLLYHPDPRKGAEDGIAALTRLQTRLPGVQIRCVGTVRSPHWPAWMPFEFHPDDVSLRRRYSAATALLYPSRYEGFGLPPLEAMACGCPPVTTAVGAVPEYATDRKDALIVPVGDVDGMVERLEEVLRNATLRRTLAEEGRATAERYALARVAPLFEQALVDARDQASA
jgi:glycosyltransferase involved in cell wall biosynthesis